MGQSLKSRGYVSEQFAWRHYYWYLNNEGIQYLREYLHLPSECVPATLRRQTARSDANRAPRPKGAESRAPGMDSDRKDYRKAGDKKDVGAGATEEFKFRGGFGRGAPKE